MGVGILFATKLQVAGGWHLVKAEGTTQPRGTLLVLGLAPLMGCPLGQKAPTRL